MINLIVAYDDQFGIGKDGTIPWKCKEDMEFFKKTTDGCTVIFGRKTWTSLKKPLSNRLSIVISKTLEEQKNGPSIYSSLVTAIHDTEKDLSGVFICGGAQIYREALQLGLPTTLYMTHIKGNYNCDTFFPSQELGDFLKKQNPTIDFLVSSAKMTITRVRIIPGLN